MIDCIERLSTHRLFYSRMVYLFFVTKLLTAALTDQEVPAGAHLTCLTDEISKEESLLACFESHKEALLNCVRLHSGA